MRQGSAPNFCPPVEEGVTLEFVDERGDAVTLEFLGLVLHGELRFSTRTRNRRTTPRGC